MEQRELKLVCKFDFYPLYLEDNRRTNHSPPKRFIKVNYCAENYDTSD